MSYMTILNAPFLIDIGKGPEPTNTNMSLSISKTGLHLEIKQQPYRRAPVHGHAC